MAKNKKLSKAARWTNYLRRYGARSWRELTLEQRVAAYERGLRYWRNHSSTLPENWG